MGHRWRKMKRLAIAPPKFSGNLEIHSGRLHFGNAKPFRMVVGNRFEGDAIIRGIVERVGCLSRISSDGANTYNAAGRFPLFLQILLSVQGCDG